MVTSPPNDSLKASLSPLVGSPLHSFRRDWQKKEWLLSSPQASPKVEASDRPKQAQHLPTSRKVKTGKNRVHQGLSDSRGMGVVDSQMPIFTSPSIQTPKNQAKQLPHHSNSRRLARDALVFGTMGGLNSDPTPVISVDNTSQTVPQPSFSQHSTTCHPPRRSVAETYCPSKVINKDHLQVKMGLHIFEKWCRENLVDFSNPSVKQVSHFSCTCTKI